MVQNIQTPRLTLIPMTAALITAEIERPAEFAALLGATVPENWPPETLRDALPWFASQLRENGELTGWLGWYGLLRGPQGDVPPTLLCSGGFLGPPQDGTAETGYSVLPQAQGQGYGTEMVRGLVQWAFSQPGVRRVVAETGEENLPSRRLLEKIGFIVAGQGREPGDLRYMLFAATGA
ncbi:MAG: GNAT family N-acetyltransferase [Cytophagales bacterium]|nr:GNAT family N-acetyltransferase [Armatimonadota bacterium]